MRLSVLLAALAFAAPAVAVAQGAPSPKAATPRAAVEEYIRAASDSNVHRMRELFGNAKGNALHTKLPAIDKKIVVMQAYLSGTKVATQAEFPGANTAERMVQAEVARGTCKASVGFKVVQSSRDGWLVNSFDMSAINDALAPCHRAS